MVPLSMLVPAQALPQQVFCQILNMTSSCVVPAPVGLLLIQQLTCSTSAFKVSNDVNDASVNVFPNPTTGEFTVQLAGFSENSTVTLKVINMIGEIVYSKDQVSIDNSAIDVNLGDVPAGLYNIQVTDGINRYNQNISVAK